MSESGGNPNYTALFKELRRLGYIEGVNLVVTRYSGEGQEERFPELCRQIVRTKPDVIIAASSRLVLSFKAATDTVPVVGAMGDPVPVGSQHRAAGRKHHGSQFGCRARNLGQALASPARSCPTASKVGFLGSRQLWSLPSTDVLRKDAQQLGISLLGPPIESPIRGEEYRRILGAMAQEHVDAVIIGDQTENVTHHQLIVDLVRAAKLPAIFPFREYFEIGALLVYGPSSSDVYRRLAGYIDQILKGARPGD
jgi:putative tryptophan/tyrosine transport system substrate-binding protein